MIKWLLFETAPGCAFLALLERWCGLAVVDLEELTGPEMRIIGARERASSANA